MPKIVELITTRSDRVAPAASLRDVASRMLDVKTSSVIVVDQGAILGIITERDMLRAMRQRRPLEQTARETMTSPVHSVPANTDFRLAYREAANLGIRHIVVTDEAGLPLGVVSEADYRKHLGPDFFLHLNTADTLMEGTFPRLPASAPLDEALVAMETVRGSCVIVVDGRRPQGIVTEHDIVRLFLSSESNPTLGSVMTHPTISVREDCPLADAAQQMLDHGIRHLTVVDSDGNLAGLLSEHTLMSPLKLGLIDDALIDRQALARAREAMLDETARNERYQRALLDNFPFLVWLKDTESRLLTANRALTIATGTDTAVGKTDSELWPPELASAYRADDLAVMASRQNKIVVEPIIVGGQPVWHETYKAPVIGDDGTLLGTVGFARDISERKRAEEAMQLRNQALAGLIAGEALPRVLELIALSVEAEIPGWHCSILLADKDGRQLRLGAAPSLPPAYGLAVDGMPIAPGVASSGAAAATRQRVIVDNINEHPNWVNYRDLADHGCFSACWSEPVIGTNGQLLGTFTAYYPSPTSPHEDYLGLLLQAAQLTALVIERQNSLQDQERSLATFRGIFDSIGEALFIQGEDRRFLDVNTSAEQMFGLSRSSLIGQTHESLIAPGMLDPEAIDQAISTALAGTPQIFETLARSSAERIFPIEVRLHTASYFGRPVLIASAVDISERKNAELRLEVEHDLAQALASGMQRDEVLGALLKAIQRFPDLDAGCVHWRQADGSYRLIAHQGVSLDFAEKVRHLDADSRLAILALNGGTICNCETPNEHCADASILDKQAMQSEGLDCLAALPIKLESQPVACLTLGSRQAAGVLPSTLASLEKLSGQFSQALHRLAAQEEARRLQENLSGLFDTLTDFIFILDQTGRILHYNRAVAEDLGYGQSSLKGKTVAAVHPENLRQMAGEVMADIISGRRYSCPLPILRASGEQIMVETRVVNGYWDGQPALIGISQDISERLMAEERQQLAASVFDNAHEGIMITDPKGRIVEVNTTFTELTGYSRAEALGNTPDMLKSGHHDTAFYEEMWQKIRDDGYWRGEIWNRKKSGEIFVEQLTISSVRNRDGALSNFVAIFSDITLLKQHQQRLEHLAHFDALTQLPNRMLLGDRMQLAKAQAERSGKTLAVCYLDLDNFKPINDRYGHSVGDFLLIEVAQRLKTCVRAGDTVARLGGDEFVLLITNLDDLNECDHAMTRVISALSQPFRVSAQFVTVSASIGVTLYPHDGSDSDTLLRHADQSMYAAKQEGRNRYHLFDPENDRRARIRREEIGQIREGLANGEFKLYYQPKVNMREGSFIGAEALIRWQHPERGLLLPDSFLPALEGSELAIEIGDWVIQEALKQIDAWHRTQGIDLSVSINIAGIHLQHPGFSRRLGELLAAYPNVTPGQIELEVLETAALEDIQTTAELFAECRNLGVTFALDDFGTGYSSLTYFRRLPADMLKIDQSFIRNMLDDTDDLAIVEGVIGLTHAFKRQVIAEGVETVEHGLVLLLLGCDMAQGFGIARPMPPEQLPDWIRHFQPDELWSLATAFEWSREDLPMLIAEVDHKRWKKQLYSHLDNRRNGASLPAMDEHACRFGRWYYSPESQRYASIEAFKTLETVHTRLHEIGRQFIQHIQAGELDAIEPLKLELDSVSSQISDYIRQIQAEVLLKNQIGK
ncbi:MAG: diguanylate cyclase/phosphodiesterase with sensor(s) [Proteobacteria bacterium]|nr:diguanylate cyclase/phosphodiesterase with sensor(s) [Pseudomonadota bacterium]